MTFARRLVAGTLVVLVVTVTFLVLMADRALRRDLAQDLADNLLREARLARDAIPATGGLPDALRRTARGNGHRLTLLAPDGRVLADSDVDSTVVPRLPAERARPEVAAALAGREGSDTRTGEDARRPTLFVAVPGGPGVVRVAAPMTERDQIADQARGAMTGAALVALLVGVLLALLAGRSVTQPLSALAGAARAIAAGAPPRFPRSEVHEIDALVQALRQMQREAGERIELLRAEQAESGAMVEAMVEGVIAANRRGDIVTANAAARRMLGYADGAALPKLTELFRAKAAREAVNAVLLGTTIEGRELDLDGRVLLMNARPLPAGGAVLVLHDLTELRRLETVRRDFVANVSHELKTPLTSISGYAETLLGEAPDPATAQRFLGIILGNARRMQRLVDDLLDLSRLESGGWQPKSEEVDIAIAAREVWAGLAERAAQRGVQFALEVAPDAESCPADADAVRQILTNLMDNSLRYTPAGGTIRCRTQAVDGGVTIEVRDTGSGIGREHLPRIFERFYRVDPSRSREEGGTGLGLAIVKHMTEAHGGRVTAESELGRGTAIRVWFPVRPAAS